MRTLHRTAAVAGVALAFGLTAGVALPKEGDDDGPGGTTTTGTTTSTTTGTTTGTTTSTTTGTTTGTTTPTTPSPTTGGTIPRSPRITEIEVDDARGPRLRLRAEVKARGRAVTSVRFVYRGRRIKAYRRAGTSTWARTVRARGGDERADRIITVRVTACAGARCTTRTGRDDA